MKIIKYSLGIDMASKNMQCCLTSNDAGQTLTTITTRSDLQLDSELSYHWLARLHLSKESTLDGFKKWWNNLPLADPAIIEPYYYGVYNIRKRNWENAIRSFKNVNEELVEDDEMLYLLWDYLFGLNLDFQGNQVEALNY